MCVCVCWYLLGDVLGVSYPGPALFYIYVETKLDWFISQIFLVYRPRHIIRWVRGERRETCQHRQWLAGPLSAAVKQEGNKKNSWSTHRLLSDMTTSGCQWTVSKPLNTHTHRIDTSPFFLSVYTAMILFLPFHWMRSTLFIFKYIPP